MPIQQFNIPRCVPAQCDMFCDAQVGRSVDETLRLVQAFQYTDHKGEGIYIIIILCMCISGLILVSRLFSTHIHNFILFVLVCPAGWKPGEMAVSHVNSMMYRSLLPWCI